MNKVTIFEEVLAQNTFHSFENKGFFSEPKHNVFLQSIYRNLSIFGPGYPNHFHSCTLINIYSDLAPPTIYNQELACKRLERNLNFLICKENQTWTRMTQINI